MSTHKHHHCKCEHDNVQFCKTCKLVHCLDCGFEWKHGPCTLNHYNYWGTYQYPNTFLTTGQQSLGQATSGGPDYTTLLKSVNTNIVPDGHTVTCSHTESK